MLIFSSASQRHGMQLRLPMGRAKPQHSFHLMWQPKQNNFPDYHFFKKSIGYGNLYSFALILSILYRHRFITNHIFGMSTESSWNILACIKVSLSNSSKRTVIMPQSLLKEKFWSSSFLNLESTSKGRLTDCMKDIGIKAWIRAALPSPSAAVGCTHIISGKGGAQDPLGITVLQYRTWLSAVGGTYYSINLGHQKSRFFSFLFFPLLMDSKVLW